MAERRIINGYIVERRDDGSIVTIGPANVEQNAGPRPVTIGQADPNRTARSAADLVNAQNNAATSGFGPDAAAMDLRLKNLELQARLNALEKGQQEAAETQKNETAKTYRDRLKTGNILDVIKQVRSLANKGGTEWGSLLSPVPGSTALDLKAAIAPIEANLAFGRLAEMRAESTTGAALGSISERELDLLGAAVASLNQAQSKEQFLDNLGRIEKHFIGSQLALSGIDPASEQGKGVFSEYGIGGLRDGRTPPDNPDARDMRPENYRIGIEERFATDSDKKFAAAAQALFDQGATLEQLNAFSQQYGYQPWGEDLDAALQYRERGGKGAQIFPTESGFNDPSILQRGINAVGSSAAGGYLEGAANAFTLGGLDELQGVMKGDSISDAWNGTGVHTAEADLRKNLVRRASPTASTIGNITGSVLGAYGTGALAGAPRLATAFAPRALAADAVFGAASGAGEQNQDRLGGAMWGTALGAAGGATGRGVVNTIGGAVRGAGPRAQTMREHGVTLTPGQIGASSDGLVGNYLKRREDRLAGFSGIGDFIGQKQRRGIDQWNRAVFREGTLGRDVPPGIGEAAIDHLDAVTVPNAYRRALDGQNFTADQQFIAGMRQNLDEAANLPAIGDQAHFSIQRSMEPFIDDAGNISGRNFQRMTQELQRRAARFDKSDDAVGPDAANVLRQSYDTLGDMVDRQAPGIMPAFREANDIFSNTQILKDAVGRAVNNGGRVMPSQLGLATRDAAKRYGGKYASTERPFFELQRAGQDLLPSKIPDSGTAGRQAAGDGFTGTLKSISRNARMPLYSDPVLDALNYLAIQRGPGMGLLGTNITNQARTGGLLGTAGALSAYNY